MQYGTELDQKVIDAAMARGYELRSEAYHELRGAIGRKMRRVYRAVLHLTAPRRFEDCS